MAELRLVYAERICFYGRVLSRDQVMDAKRRALDAEPSFHQEIIGPVTLERGGPDASIIVSFLKRSGTLGHPHDVPARLLLQQFGWEFGRGVPWLIFAENDGPTSPARDRCEGAIARDQANIPAVDSRCDQTAATVVQELPEVKAAIAEAHKEIKSRSKDEPSIGFGGFGPQPNGNGTYTVVMGINTPERLESIVSYIVDRRAGGLAVAINSGVAPQLPEPARRVVEAACKE